MHEPVRATFTACCYIFAWKSSIWVLIKRSRVVVGFFWWVFLWLVGFVLLVVLGHLIIALLLPFPLQFFSHFNWGQMHMCRWHQSFSTVCPIPLFWLKPLVTFCCLADDKWGLEWDGNELRSEFMGLWGTIC